MNGMHSHTMFCDFLTVHNHLCMKKVEISSRQNSRATDTDTWITQFYWQMAYHQYICKLISSNTSDMAPCSLIHMFVCAAENGEKTTKTSERWRRVHMGSQAHWMGAFIAR